MFKRSLSGLSKYGLRKSAPLRLKCSEYLHDCQLWRAQRAQASNREDRQGKYNCAFCLEWSKPSCPRLRRHRRLFGNARVERYEKLTHEWWRHMEHRPVFHAQVSSVLWTDIARNGFSDANLGSYTWSSAMIIFRVVDRVIFLIDAGQISGCLIKQILPGTSLFQTTVPFRIRNMRSQLQKAAVRPLQRPETVTVELR